MKEQSTLLKKKPEVNDYIIYKLVEGQWHIHNEVNSTRKEARKLAKSYAKNGCWKIRRAS